MSMMKANDSIQNFTYTNIHHDVKYITQIDDFSEMSDFKTNKSATW